MRLLVIRKAHFSQSPKPMSRLCHCRPFVRSPQQQQVIAAYENAMNEMTVQIIAMLTPRQKLHLTKEIASINDDFKKLNAATEAISSK